MKFSPHTKLSLGSSGLSILVQSDICAYIEYFKCNFQQNCLPQFTVYTGWVKKAVDFKQICQ